MQHTAEKYILMREAYCYCDRDSEFEILPTPTLHHQFVRKYHGIFARTIPPFYQLGINLRTFESLVHKIFEDVDSAERTDSIKVTHISNLMTIVCAVVHWKMASQGGRAKHKTDYVRINWREATTRQLVDAYRTKRMAMFVDVDGIAIPTATAFMRLIFPAEYGIMDSRVVKITQREGITQLNIRPDGYICNCKNNKDQYGSTYVPFLVNEAQQLIEMGVTFEDIDDKGALAKYTFRPCDIEMALFTA